MTADERLALVRLKIERADKHIDELKVAIRVFLDSQPYKVGTKRNPQTRQLIYYLTRVEPVPVSVALVTGDILHCLRDALDHLAQQLYLVGSAGAKGYRDQTSFPIAQSPKKLKAGFAGKVEGMRKDAVEAIRALEPYAGGKGDDLWTLHRLNNIDKHRLIIAVGSTYRSLDLGAIGLQKMRRAFPHLELPDISAFFEVADNRFPLKTGDELLADTLDSEPNEKLKFTFEVALHEPRIIEGKPVVETLVQFRDRVNGIVEAFRPCLS